MTTPEQERLNIIAAVLNGQISSKKFEKAMKKDPELRKLWDNRWKRKDDDT